MDYSLNEEAKIGEKRGGTNTHKAECLRSHSANTYSSLANIRSQGLNRELLLNRASFLPILRIFFLNAEELFSIHQRTLWYTNHPLSSTKPAASFYYTYFCPSLKTKSRYEHD